MTASSSDSSQDATQGGQTVPGNEPAFDTEVDARGLKCPLPILRAKKALATLESGQVLKVLTTDINAVRDFQAFCRQTGNTLLKQIQADGQVSHYLARR